MERGIKKTVEREEERDSERKRQREVVSKGKGLKVNREWEKGDGGNFGALEVKNVWQGERG